MPRPPRTATESPVEPVSSGDLTRSTLARLTELGEADSPQGQAALVLARALDAGAGMAAAAFVKELRATLKELTPRDGGDDFGQLMASLSAEIRNATPH